MRFLLGKDLRILSRSPLLIVLLVAYPLVISLLIGLALSRSPDKPTVAFFNSETDQTVNVGSKSVDTSRYTRQLFQSLDLIPVESREQAVNTVDSGKAVAAILVPDDITEKLSSGLEQPTVEVIYSAENPVRARYVEDTIKAKIADANVGLAREFGKVALGYINQVLAGGTIEVFGRSIEILGLERTETVLRAALDRLPANSPDRAALKRVVDFARLAVDNFNLYSGSLLTTVAEPIKVKRTVLDGRKTPLDAFAIAASVTLSLMFVSVLMAAGLLALEREERTFTRLVRTLVSRGKLLLSKALLAAVCGFTMSLALLAGIGLFVPLEWGRLALWVVSLAVGSVAFAALGVAVGAVAREVRAASLLAFLLTLPLAFLALVPEGAVSDRLFDVIEGVSALFPFKPTLTAIGSALSEDGKVSSGVLLHLAGLAAGFLALARLSIRKFS